MAYSHWLNTFTGLFNANWLASTKCKLRKSQVKCPASPEAFERSTSIFLLTRISMYKMQAITLSGNQRGAYNMGDLPQLIWELYELLTKHYRKTCTWTCRCGRTITATVSLWECVECNVCGERYDRMKIEHPSWSWFDSFSNEVTWKCECGRSITTRFRSQDEIVECKVCGAKWDQHKVFSNQEYQKADQQPRSN
jgi:hypothetical protein